VDPVSLVAEALALAGDAEAAQTVLAAARATAEDIDFGYDRAWALCDVARVLIEVEGAAAARAVLAAARAAAESVSQPWLRSPLLAAVAEALIQVEMIARRRRRRFIKNFTLTESATALRRWFRPVRSILTLASIE
jgi:ATP/maltotriose-dependent transcriptional regulator MalT